jgi:hypothetical protein
MEGGNDKQRRFRGDGLGRWHSDAASRLPVGRSAGRHDEPPADEAAIEARVAQVCDDILAGRVALRQIFALETALQRLRLNLMLDRAIRRMP